MIPVPTDGHWGRSGGRFSEDYVLNGTDEKFKRKAKVIRIKPNSPVFSLAGLHGVLGLCEINNHGDALGNG
ncbi:MAG: hypothetical protein WCY88_07920 [Spongiibacteraceae bacterium]